MGAQTVIQCHRVPSNLKKLEENLQKEGKLCCQKVSALLQVNTIIANLTNYIVSIRIKSWSYIFHKNEIFEYDRILDAGKAKVKHYVQKTCKIFTVLLFNTGKIKKYLPTSSLEVFKIMEHLLIAFT